MRGGRCADVERDSSASSRIRPEAEDVVAGIALPPRQPLRRDVSQAARRAGLPRAACRPEVSENGAIGGREEHVRGLHVVMHPARGVDARKRRGERERPTGRSCSLQSQGRVLSAEVLLERAERRAHSSASQPRCFRVDVEDPDDAWPGERRGDARLVDELLATAIGVMVDLQRDPPPELAVLRFVDRPRPAARDLAQENEGASGSRATTVAAAFASARALLLGSRPRSDPPSSVALTCTGVVEVDDEDALDEGERLRHFASLGAEVCGEHARLGRRAATGRRDQRERPVQLAALRERRGNGDADALRNRADGRCGADGVDRPSLLGRRAQDAKRRDRFFRGWTARGPGFAEPGDPGVLDGGAGGEVPG